MRTYVVVKILQVWVFICNIWFASSTAEIEATTAATTTATARQYGARYQ